MNEWSDLISERMRPDELGLDFSYPDMGDLLPITILCGIPLLLAALWLLAVSAYVCLTGRQQ